MVSNHRIILFFLQIIFACLLAVAAAAPDSRYAAPPSYSAESDEVPILQDDRVYPSAAGEYSTDTETGDGIKTSASGYGGDAQGSVSFTFPDGQDFELSYVADAEGYKPQSAWLPVAPAFPHPIPQFVLDQIAFAASQKDSSEEEQRYSYQ